MSPGLLGFLNQGTETYEGLDANGNPIYSSNPAFKFDSTNKVFALGAQLDFLQKNGAAHLLSEPSVLCTNNKEAEIYVGQTMSILTAAQQSTTGVSNVVNNYSREDIGLTLKVKPRLSSNNQVTLEVEVQIEDLDPSSEQIADRPTTTKRTVKTNTIVKDGEIVILGGLIKRVGGKAKSEVPYLSQLPILGDLLFTHNSDVEREQNVVVYLTPYIVRRSADLQELKRMLSELDEVQERYNRLVEKAIKGEGGASSPDNKVPASNRISRTSQNTTTVTEVEQSSSPSNRIRRAPKSNLDLLNEPEAL